MDPLSLLQHKILGNTLESYLLFILILIFGIFLKRWLSGKVAITGYLVIRRYGKSVGRNKFIQLLTEPIEILLTVLVVYLALNQLHFPDNWHFAAREEFGIRMILHRLFKMAIVVSVFWIVLRIVDFIALILLERAAKTESLADDQIIRFVKEAIKVGIGGVGFFMLLGVAFELNVVSLITGLGIGGLAIALAAKETLENLLGSFTIFLDKPFITGDSVRVGDVEGKVESVGFRSTRIRAVDKMLVTVPNKKMVDAELINETDRQARRSSGSILLDYDTDINALSAIIIQLRTEIETMQLIEKGSVNIYFENFQLNGIRITISYTVLCTDMKLFLSVQEKINFVILRIVKENNSKFFELQNNSGQL